MMQSYLGEVMKECWINVYEYKTVKNTQFYSHELPNEEEARFRAFMRNSARPDSKCVYRIHVKMKEVKGLTREYPFKFNKPKPLVFEVEVPWCSSWRW